MIHHIADGATLAFIIAALWSDGAASRLAWAAAAASFSTSCVFGTPRSYGWAGFYGAAAVALFVSAAGDWAKARRRKVADR